MKKVFGFLFCFLFVLSVPSVCAVEKASNGPDVNAGREEWVLQVIDGQEILFNSGTGETIPEAHRIINGQAVPVSLQELCIALNSSLSEESFAADLETSITDDPTDPDVARRAPVYFYRFEDTQTSRVNGSPEKVTDDYIGPTQISIVTSVTITESYGGSFTLSATAKNAISDSASFTWNRSLASGTSVGAAYDVPDGQIGYIEFVPYLNKITGSLYEAFSDPTTGYMSDYVYKGQAWGTCPIRLNNGIADGLFYPVYRNA